VFRERESGFTYIGLLIAVVLMGLALSAVGTVWRTSAQRERERELLYIGHEFRAAIAAYYAAGGRQYPQQVSDLLEDKRGPKPNHYLRRLYADPMTGQAEWNIIRTESLGITGISSTSTAVPIKKGGFSPEEESFGDAESYSDWKFIFVPRNGRRQLIQNPITNR
jgi:type II secretory pathway pseudopilin PulG